MILRDIIAVLESFAPPAYQEDYDNTGLTIGDKNMEVSAALLCLDVTEDVISEALLKGANLIISHHPAIFHPLKKLTGENHTERIVARALSGNIALYCMHTNIDNIYEGVNQRICQKLELLGPVLLKPRQDLLRKLVTFVPSESANEVREKLFQAGAGHIGRYEKCSFNIEGRGTYFATDEAKPYRGKIGKLHEETETRIEVIFPAVWTHEIVRNLLMAHPYEEVAYDILPLDNPYSKVGSGMAGELAQAEDAREFLQRVKNIFHCPTIRHSSLPAKPIQKVAVCGGSGAYLMQTARNSGADIFLTGEIPYHQFFEADQQMMLADIGHYESEQYTIEIFYEILQKKLPTFAVHFSSINTNPIYYL
jgi:dinuclear metal center YbgI/SA1388 family protein